MRAERRQLLRSLLAARFAGLASLVVVRLRLSTPSAPVRYPGQTRRSNDVEYLVLWTALHSIELFLLLLWWFAEKQPDLSTIRGIVLSIAAALIGALLAVMLGPGGIVLIVTGQAFVTSCVAVVVYALIAPG